MNIRAPEDADFQDVLALLQAADVALIGESDWTEQELREEWEEADLEHNAWLVELDGRLAGYALVIDRSGGRLNADGYVQPGLRGHGVGSKLLQLTEERARVLADGAENGRIVLHNATLTADPTVPALYERRGYEAARHFLRMMIDLGDELPEPARAEGFEIASYDHPREARAVHETVQEAFAGEWNFHPETFAEFERRKLGAARFDPGLWFVAHAYDEVVGAILCDSKRMGDWGWVGAIAVREAWRRRGIGEALLVAAFREFHGRGERRVALGVDVQNPTGATRLYERVGMRVFWEAVVYEKVLRG
jgi:mycothiol synthase